MQRPRQAARRTSRSPNAPRQRTPKQRPKPEASRQEPISIAPPQKRRRGRTFFNFILIVGIAAAIGSFLWAERQRRAVIGQLEATETELEEVKDTNGQDGNEVAAQILEKARRHMVIPQEPEPTVATIADVESLRATSPFYNKAENGYNLIVTGDRAILYDPEQDRIIDVAPVNAEAQAPAPTEPTAAPTDETSSEAETTLEPTTNPENPEEPIDQ